MSTNELTLTTSRKATAEEVDDLIFGTGGLSYPWWDGAHKTPRGYRFYFDRPEDEEGTHKGNRWVSNQAILNAVSRFIAEGRLVYDVQDVMTESIGYLDADAADVVLQYAVLGAIVYG